MTPGRPQHRDRDVSSAPSAGRDGPPHVEHTQLPPPRWWLFPPTTVLVVALQGSVWVRPGLSWLQVASGPVLVLALGVAAVCLVRAPRWPDARPVGIGPVWALPIGFIDLMVSFAQR